MSNATNSLYEFGSYRLDVEQRAFTCEGQTVALAPKTFELLLLLVRSPRRAFSKQELMTSLWPDVFVEEANLSFQISALRKALGADALLIETVPKHGYRFVADVRATASIGSAAHRPAATRHEEHGAPAVPEVASALRGAAAAPRAERRRLRRVLALSLVVSALAGIVWWKRGENSRSAAPAVAPLERVAVEPFENRTGEPSLDSLGKLVADRINQGLGEIGQLEVVTGQQAADGIVSGSYYRQGTSVRFQAQLTRQSQRKLLASAGPADAPAGDPSAAIESLTKQIVGHTACFAHPRMAAYAHAIRLPSSFEAYKEYSRALELFYRFEHREAIVHLEKMRSLDPDFIFGRQLEADASLHMGDRARADEVLRALSGARTLMTPFEHATQDMLEALLAGDRAAAYRGFRRWAELAPAWTVARLNTAVAALQLNRPREAVEWFLTLDPASADLANWEEGYWDFRTTARHMTRDHVQELRDAGLSRRQYPDSLATLSHEVRALAALGRTAEIEARVREAAAMKSRNPAASVMRIAGEELRAHGYATESKSLLEQAAAWYRGRPAPEAATQDIRSGLARTEYLAGRWTESRTLYETLQKEFPGNIDYLGMLAAIAAHQGRRGDARRVAAELRDLTRPNTGGRHTLWRARIAALLNERAEALTLLREAFSQGVPHGLALHVDPAFDGLRGDPGFRELIEPKG